MKTHYSTLKDAHILGKNINMYLNIGKIHMVLFKKANEFLEVLFCRVIMTAVWPNSLR